jgi:hypothetical protein
MLRARRRRSRWLWRGALGAILAAALAAAATLSASASSLPGQPLYGLKQATEELGVRFARDDQARTLILLRQANARLDETAQLLEVGRTDQVADSTQRFDDALDRATTSFVVTIAAAPDEAGDPTTAQVEATFGHQQVQLETMLASAPEPTRAELRAALVETERSRALVAPSASSSRTAADTRSVVEGAGVVLVPTDTPPHASAASPPHDDVASHTPDATPVVQAEGAAADHHEASAQRALEAHADARDPSLVVSVRTPVEHLKIPPLAPASAVVPVHVRPSARGSDPNPPDPDQPNGTAELHASGAGPSVAVTSIAQHGQPRTADDHAVAPTPNHSDALQRVAVEPTTVTAQQPSNADSVSRASAGSGSLQAAPQLATPHAAHDAAASAAPSSLLTPMPVAAVAAASAHAGPSTPSSPPDTHRDGAPTAAHGSTPNVGNSGTTSNSHPPTTSSSNGKPAGGGSNTGASGGSKSGGGSSSANQSNSGGGHH